MSMRNRASSHGVSSARVDRGRDGFKNVGPYSAQAYEGVVRRDRSRVQELKLGMRYHFLPGLCMMQWRHSALLNAAKRTDEGWQVRLEGIWIE